MKQEYKVCNKILSQEELRILQSLLEKAKGIIPEATEFHVRGGENDVLYLEGWNLSIVDGQITQYVIEPSGEVTSDWSLIY